MSHKDTPSRSAIRSKMYARSHVSHLLLQERQRLETILNLCAEYNHEDSAAELAEVVRNGLFGVDSDTRGGTSLQGPDRHRRMTENDEEAQREECSSTESTHQEVSCDTCCIMRVVSSDWELDSFFFLI